MSRGYRVMKNKETKEKPVDNKASSSGSNEVQTSSVQEIVNAWESFKPKVPLSYTLASHAAARLKNGQ